MAIYKHNKASFQKLFPRLNNSNFQINSPNTIDYNCIAWAADNNTHWWWPTPEGYWPDSIDRSLTVQSFIDAYGTIGYRQCVDGSVESGYEKIVIYVNSLNEPTHAAKQLSSGKWTSKIGEAEDIIHDSEHCVESDIYGTVAVYLKRKNK